MEVSLRLKELFIGIADGAMEAQDDKFQDLYYDLNNKYDELMKNKEKFIVLGNKGTGKTYLANYVLKKASNKQTTAMVDASDFWICKLVNQDREALGVDIIAPLCRWFLIEKLAQMLIEKHKYKSRFLYGTKLYRLRKFLDKNENLDFFKPIRMTASNTKENNFSGELGRSICNVEQTKNSNGVAGAGVRKEKGVVIESERKQFFELLQSFEKLFFQCIQDEDDLLLIIDDLDEMERININMDFGTLIVNLITVTREINCTAQQYNKKIKIILLLRSDVLNKLQSKNANLNKIKTSCSVELYWLFDSMSEPYEHPLMSMILRKIKAYSPVCAEWSNKKLYNELFPEEIDDKRALDYLLDYSHGRPRDIVTYLNHAKNQFPEETSFSARILKEVKKLYAADFYDEMLNQASFHEQSDYIIQCFNLLASIKKVSFTYEMIQSIYEANQNRYDKIDNLDYALSFLYRMGAIGNVWNAGKGSNRKLYSSWSYKKDAMDDVDLSKKFTIHYGLRKKFSM